MEVLTGQSFAEALDGAVQLTTGDEVVTGSLIWRAGVRADPLVDGLDLATSRGRLGSGDWVTGRRGNGAPGVPEGRVRT